MAQDDYLYQTVYKDPMQEYPDVDVSALKDVPTARDTTLFHKVSPGLTGISIDPYGSGGNYMTEWGRILTEELDPIQKAQAPAPVVDTPVDTGAGGGGLDVVDTLVNVNTPFEQNLIDQGAGVQGAPGDPVVAPGEMPVTQEEMDAFNQIPVTPANLQDPTKMLPQISTQPDLGEVTADDYGTPTVIAGTAPLEDAGAGIDDVYGTDYGFGTEKDFVQNEDLIDRGNPLDDPRIAAEEFESVPPPSIVDPIMDPNLMDIRQQQAQEGLTTEQSNTLQNIIGQAGQTVEGAMNQLSKIPGAVADFANQTVDIFGKKFNVGKTLAMGAINKLAGGPISLVFDALGAIAPQDSLENKTTRSIVDELKAEEDYGFNMQSGNLNQDPFGRNPVSAFGDYEQTLMDDLAGTGKWANLQTAEMTEAKKQFAQDYFNKKAEKAGGAEVEDGVVLGPGEAPGEDLVTAEELAEQKFQDEIDAGIAAADEEPSPTVTTPTFEPRGGGADRDPAPAPAPAAPVYEDAIMRGQTGGGSDPGGGKSIICTAMYQTTGLEDWSKAMKIWYIYQKKYLTIQHQEGYHKLFKPFVKGMHKNNIIKAIGAHVARHRTQDLKHVMFGSKPSWLGRVYRKILEPICYWVGKYAKR